MQVKVTVNERGALRNWRFAFTDRFTLVTELLQNSRRAGATQIWVSYDAAKQILTVEDDGSGIADFQKLLTLNESGWDEAVLQQEQAFGVGFSNVLYAATRCTVQSRGLSMVFSTEAALRQEAIDVVDDSAAHPYRTRIVLEGVELPGLDRQLPELVCGFPLPIEFNGADVPRPHSEGALSFTATPVGLVHLHGRDTGEAACGTYIYLQGFCVKKARWDAPAIGHVVHLDSRQFVARLPDRRVLIDEADQLQRVRSAKCDLWRAVLSQAKLNLAPEPFCDRYWETARHWGCQDLFDDVPVLPRQVCAQITSYPVQVPPGEDDGLEALARPVTRQAIESGAVRLVSLGSAEDSNLAHWMFARHRGDVVVQAYALSKDHWARSHVSNMEDEKVVVSSVQASPSSPCLTARFEGRWIDVPVQLCERVSIRLGREAIEIADEAVWDGRTLFVPAAESSGFAVQQVSGYTDADDHFCEQDRDADCDALADLIARLRYTDPCEAFKSCLGELALRNLPLVCGRTYLLRVDDAGQVGSVELVETIDATHAVVPA